MNITNFKKITYVIAVVLIVLCAYLAFFRKLTNGDSATMRNAKFLGIKSITVQNNVSNQKDLNIDGDKNTTASNVENQSSTTPSATASSITDKNSSFYTVKEGDTYGCISESYYGSYEHWQDILNANTKYGNGFSEYHLHVGAVLEMPSISADNLKPKSNLCS